MHLYIDASRANAQEPTGVEEYAWHTIEELKKIVPPEWRVSLFLREPLREPLSILPDNWQSRVLGWWPRRLWTQMRLSIELLKIKLRTTRPQRLSVAMAGVAHYALRTILFIPAHVMPLVHLPYTVVTIHDVGALRFPETYSAFERWYIRWSTAFALRHGAHIIVPSEFTKKEILSIFPPLPEGRLGGEGAKRFPLPSVGEGKGEGAEDRIHVIPLAYDAERYHANLDPTETERVIAKYGIARPYLYFQGRIEEKKNLARLVEAFTQFSYNLSPRSGIPFAGQPTTYNLVLTGKPGYGFERVKATIDLVAHATPPAVPPLSKGGKSGESVPLLNKEGLGEVCDRIRLLGYVPPEDAPHLMAGATAFVFPSLYEGFGIPVLEAMAVGTPVIASRAGSLPEVGGDAALYFDSQNVEDMTSALSRIMQDQPLRETLRTRGFERVKSFSWRKTAEDTFKVFASKRSAAYTLRHLL